MALESEILNKTRLERADLKGGRSVAETCENLYVAKESTLATPGKRILSENITRLREFFNPASIAVIGASREPSKPGNVILRNLKRSGLSLYAVNPYAKEIAGVKCYSSVFDIPGIVDMAVIVVPSKFVIQELKKCVARRIKNIIIISSGFSEAGEEGRKAEEEARDIIKESGAKLLGPNTLGMLLPNKKIDTFFVDEYTLPRPRPGDVAFISQSGSISLAFMDFAKAHNIGLSAFVGLGNKLDIDENQLLEYFGEDEETKCILLYLETFSDGRKFAGLCKEICKKKPVIVLKAGRTARGVSAAMSHTGRLSKGSDRIVDCVLKRAGVIRAYTEEDVLDYTAALSWMPPMKKGGVAIVANGGGHCVISADLIESSEDIQLRLAEIGEIQKEKIKSLLDIPISATNPIDLTAMATDDTFKTTLSVLAKTETVEGVIVELATLQGVSERMVKIVQNFFKNCGKPIIVCVPGGDSARKLAKKFEAEKIPVYPSLKRGICAANVLLKRGMWLDRIKNFRR